MGKKYGLIGHPIHDSKSPLLFGAAYGKLRQSDGSEYSYDLIEGEDFAKSWKTFLGENPDGEGGYHAINVTAPFKEQAYSEVLALTRQGKGLISGPAARIGATNLLVKTAEGIEAHNSDFTGIVTAVVEAYFPGIVRQFLKDYGDRFYIKVHQYFLASIERMFKDKPQALIVGCGGAGRAAAVAAAELGFATVLMNRTPEKAQRIADSLPEYSFIVDPIADFKEAVKECDLIIYTLPMALPEIACLTADDFAGEGSGHGKVILEANYKNPSFGEEQRLKMQFADAKYIPGCNWLINQALTGYSLMTGLEPDLDAMEEAFSL